LAFVVNQNTVAHLQHLISVYAINTCVKILEILKEYDDNDSWAEHKSRVWLMEFLESRGYKFMGEGQDAMVFRNGRGTVLKVYGFNQDPGRGDKPRDQFKFYRIAKKINSPFVPRFGEPKTISVKGITYTIIPTEELSAMPQDPEMEYTLVTWLRHCEPYDLPVYAGLTHALNNWTSPAAQKTINRGIDYLNKVGTNTFDGFEKVLVKICRSGNCNDAIENSDSNIMWRGNTPVINDPYAD